MEPSPFSIDPSIRVVTIDLSKSPVCEQELTPADSAPKRLAVGDIDEFKVTVSPDRPMGMLVDRQSETD